MIKRCLNIDWLEVYALEPDKLDADFFISDGWSVQPRPYGTRVYDEMFTLMDYTTNEPLIEVRRAPVGAKTGRSIIEPNACHIRLTNRTCYYENAAAIMAEFLARYGYQFMRISRIDLCLDFELFDTLDNPQKFIQRYMAGRYAKINQVNIRSIGKDSWDKRVWNSISWGSPSSAISTKIYNKTLELKEARDKPYIRQAWALAGLVDDFIKLTRSNAKGETYTPVIWRLEFSIKSPVKNWFVMDTDTTGKRKFHSYPNTLDRYMTKQQQLDIFASLVDHYFHFKNVQEKPCKGIARNAIRQEVRAVNVERSLERKDRCPDKVLFKFTDAETFYRVEKVASATPADRHDKSLLRKLQLYKETHLQPEIIKACDTLIEDIEQIALRKSAANPADATEIMLLRQLISRRIKGDTAANTSLSDMRAMLQLFDDLHGFGEK